MLIRPPARAVINVAGLLILAPALARPRLVILTVTKTFVMVRMAVLGVKAAIRQIGRPLIPQHHFPYQLLALGRLLPRLPLKTAVKFIISYLTMTEPLGIIGMVHLGPRPELDNTILPSQSAPISLLFLRRRPRSCSKHF